MPSCDFFLIQTSNYLNIFPANAKVKYSMKIGNSQPWFTPPTILLYYRTVFALGKFPKFSSGGQELHKNQLK